MSKRRRTLISLSALAASLCLAFTAQAEEPSGRVTTSTALLQSAAEHNPELQAALLEHTWARSLVAAERALYPLLLRADSSYSRYGQSAARLSSGGSTGTGEALSAGVELAKTLPQGTVAALRVGGDRVVRDPGTGYDAAATAEDALYGVSASLSVTQPLLRGAGRRVGEASLRQAQGSARISEQAASEASSALVRDVLSAYWELWYAQRALEIERASAELARQQLGEVKVRAQQGAAASHELLAFETRCARLDEAVVAAGFVVERAALTAARLAGLPGGASVRAAQEEEPPPPAQPPPAPTLVSKAHQRSPSLRQLQLQVDLAQDAALVAGEAARPKLDLSGRVAVSTLDESPFAGVDDTLGSGQAYSALIGLSFELPLDGSGRRSQRAAAQARVRIAEWRLQAGRQRLEVETREAASRLQAALARGDLAQRTLGAAEQQAVAERERLSLGAGLPIEVREAEDAMRAARLRVQRARIDGVLAALALDHLTGALLGSR